MNFNKKCSIKLKKQDEIEEIMEQDEDDHDEKRRRTESNLNEQLNL